MGSHGRKGSDDHVRNPPDIPPAACDDAPVIDDFERCYGALQSRDPRFDGWFFTAVTSTRIYCRPSCPAKTPKRENVRFYSTSAAAQQGGFRACLRCRPDAAPGSPEWLGRADVAARAVKLILHGTVDAAGVSGLARRLGYSERQLHRVLLAEVGTGALALARAQRAQTARLLLETTDLPVTQIAFASGFASVRQFNDTVRSVFARTPTDLRRSSEKRKGPAAPIALADRVPAQTVSLRLAYRKPFSVGPLFDFLAHRAIPRVELVESGVYTRTLRMTNGDAVVSLTPDDGFVRAEFALEDLRDLTAAVARCRQLLNLDSDPVAVDDALSKDRLLEPLVRRWPGLRVPGAADGFEIAVRAVVGQQISVTGARTVAGRLVEAAGPRSKGTDRSVTRGFPNAREIASLAPEEFPMPKARARALLQLAESVADGRISIDPGADPAELQKNLNAIPGIGPWTSSYVVMRALGDPDAFMPTDLGLKRAVSALGQPDDAVSITARAEAWRPWRSYALFHLWSTPVHGPSAKLKKGETAA
jgi:AraC family transcriptional regulator, regulatory protein of adaptative response / DNA-3-methyladenine glycosylase II